MPYHLDSVAGVGFAIHALAVVRSADDAARAWAVISIATATPAAAIVPIPAGAHPAQDEPLIRIAVNIVNLNANTITIGAIRNIERSAETRDD